jgi:hypothetical protein
VAEPSSPRPDSPEFSRGRLVVGIVLVTLIGALIVFTIGRFLR